MPASFYAYIDESGDEGFKFLPNEQGSSRWFVLSAVIFRESNKLAPVAVIREIKELLKRDPSRPLHFRDLKHEQRIACVSALAKHSFRTISIVSYKPDISDPETYQANKNLLYRYLTRLLIERISWICRDSKKEGEGDGTVKLTFSDRAAMSYKDMRDYIKMLAQHQGVQIHWPAIRPDEICARQHGQLAALQVADIVASSQFFALHLNPYGFAEPRYAAILKGQVYRHRREWKGYGVKFLSSLDKLKEKMPHVKAAFENW